MVGKARGTRKVMPEVGPLSSPFPVIKRKEREVVHVWEIKRTNRETGEGGKKTIQNVHCPETFKKQ